MFLPSTGDPLSVKTNNSTYIGGVCALLNIYIINMMGLSILEINNVFIRELLIL